MATTITIKNSSVAGKVPDVDSIQVAELALNLADKKLYSKNASDEVFEVNSVVNSGDTLPGSGTNPGDLFWDTDDETLYYWDGTQWQAIASGSAVDGEYLKLSGGNLTGDLTLGTDKITLDAAAGEITCQSNVRSNGFIQSRQTTGSDACWSGELNGNATSSILADGSITAAGNIITRANDNEFAKLEPAGVLKLQTNNAAMASADALQIKYIGNTKVALNYDGSITAAGGVDVGGGTSGTADAAGVSIYKNNNNASYAPLYVSQGSADGNLITGHNAFTGNNTFAVGSDGSITAAGTVEALRFKADQTSSSGYTFLAQNSGSAHARIDSGGIYVGGSLSDGSAASQNPNITLAADGSAEFSGNTVVGDFDLSKSDTSGIRLLASGGMQIQRDSGANNSPRFEIIRGTNDRTVTIDSDGSAKFSSNVESSGYFGAGGNPSGGAEDGSRIYAGGGIYSSKAAGSSSDVWRGYTTGNNTPTSKITSDGSITAAGSIGIGTASPSVPLHVYHATLNGVARFESGDETALIQFKDNGTTLVPPSVGTVNNSFVVQTNDTERLKIDSSGNITAAGGNTQILSNGVVQIKRDGGSLALGVFPGNNFTDSTSISLKTDGSAEFASSGSSPSTKHTINAFNSSPNTGTTSVYFAQNNAGGRLWKGSNGAETSTIWADGSAQFAGTLNLETTGASQVTYRKSNQPTGTLCTWNSDVGSTKAEVARISCDGSITAAGYSMASLAQL